MIKQISISRPLSLPTRALQHPEPHLREAVSMQRPDRPAALEGVLLVVRRDHGAAERMARIGQVAGIRTLVDRRRGERRRRDSTRGPIQTRRAERRRQKWVDEALETVGAAFVRMESPTADALDVTTELMGGRWYGVLYRRGAAQSGLTVAEIANRLWVSAPCGDDATARDLATCELRMRERQGE